MKRLSILLLAAALLAVMATVAAPITAQEATAANPFPTAAVTQPEPQATPEVTPVVNPELNDQIAALEGIGNTALERLANAALDRFALWGIIAILASVAGSIVAYFLLWKSNPARRDEIKASALGQLERVEGQIDQRLIAARETPDISDDLIYGILKGLVDRGIVTVNNLPTGSPKTFREALDAARNPET